jgi:hypothetical protein
MAFYDEISDRTNFAISYTASPKGDFGVFAKGYTLAANRLASLLLEAPRFSDYEAYPVVFLYRHALELSLKHIIYSSALLAAFKDLDEIEGGLQNFHDLRELSGIAEAILTRLFPKDESLRRAIATVTRTCHEFSEIDPRSYAYRYPIDKKGQRLTKRHQMANLRAFADRMSSVLEDLDTIHFGLSIETDVAQEVYEAIQSLPSSAAKGERL